MISSSNIANANISMLKCDCSYNYLENKLTKINGVNSLNFDSKKNNCSIEYDMNLVKEKELKDEFDSCGCTCKWE